MNAAPRPAQVGGTRSLELLGTHPRLDHLRQFARRVAEVPFARVLITGESGTGKSMLARMIHQQSRAKGSFVVVNCAALPANLLESELFGHEKGAFTDARQLKRGLIEGADEGTIFLDEIGAMPLDLQAKLLLFLENHEIRRVGGMRSMPVRTRVIAATNDDLHRLVRERSFRADLLYRLDVASVVMPPLREIPAVIPELAERFLVETATELQRPLPRLSRASFEPLVSHPWPGNVRQLRNLIERSLIFYEYGDIVLEPPTDEACEPDQGCRLPIGLSLEEVERRYLTATLQANPTADFVQLAAMLQISRKTLWEKRRRYGL